MGWLGDNVGDLATLYFKNEENKRANAAVSNQVAYAQLTQADTQVIQRPGMVPLTGEQAGFLNQSNPFTGVSNGAMLALAGVLGVVLIALRK